MLLHPASLLSHLPRLRASIPLCAVATAAAAGAATVPRRNANNGAALLLLRCRGQFRRTLHEDVARKNHYERLGVRHDASPAEIKKSFYSLSKTHHPDTNPSDPSAASTFSLLSESYTVLSDPSRRTAYDRDVLRVHHHPAHGPSNPRASYHSSNPAGGRSPSGLSRRRGTFRGPPPSFYRSGGWGDQSEKRRKAHEESTGGGSGSGSGSATSSGTGDVAGAGANRGPWADKFAYQHSHGPRHGGMGPGGDPFGHQEEVPHFDKKGHTRTHQRQDQRRWQRERRAVGDDNIEFEPQTSVTGHFFIIFGILAATILAPLVYLQVMRLGRRSKNKG